MYIIKIKKDGEWLYITAYKDGNNWRDYYTNEIINKDLIYEIQ